MWFWRERKIAMFQHPHYLWVQKFQIDSTTAARVCPHNLCQALSVPTTQHAFTEWQGTICRSLSPPKTLRQNYKSNHESDSARATKMTQMNKMANIKVTETGIKFKIEMVVKAARICFESFFSPTEL